jgi:hypothetical protein
VAASNSTVLRLKDVRGTFVASNTLYGYSSGTTANVALVTTLSFTSGDLITQETTGAKASVINVVGNTVYVANVTGQLANGSTIVGSSSTAEATITDINSADGLRDLSTSFAQRFNQTSRLTLSTLVGTFQPYEYIRQATSNANGRVINTTSDLDLTIGSLSGSFSIGETITNANTSANAKIVFANSSYLKLTSVSNTTLFTTNNSINNGIGSNAVIQSVRNVLVVADVQTNFQPGLLLITGANSGAQATVSTVTNPDLKRNSGKVIYTETSNSVINRTTSTTEEIRLTIKF